MHQFYDLNINIMLLYVFRARTWPDYFFLGIDDGMPLLGDSRHNQESEPRVIVPLTQAKLEVGNNYSMSWSDLSIHTNQEIVIYNPELAGSD